MIWLKIKTVLISRCILGPGTVGFVSANLWLLRSLNMALLFFIYFDSNKVLWWLFTSYMYLRCDWHYFAIVHPKLIHIFISFHALFSQHVSHILHFYAFRIFFKRFILWICRRGWDERYWLWKKTWGVNELCAHFEDLHFFQCLGLLEFVYCLEHGTYLPAFQSFRKRWLVSTCRTLTHLVTDVGLLFTNFFQPGGIEDSGRCFVLVMT